MNCIGARFCVVVQRLVRLLHIGLGAGYSLAPNKMEIGELVDMVEEIVSHWVM